MMKNLRISESYRRGWTLASQLFSTRGLGSPTLFALALSATCATPAISAWEAPVPISTPGLIALEPELAIDRQGNALAIWSNEDEFGVSSVEMAFRADGEGFAPAEMLGEANARLPHVAFDKRGNALAAWERHESGIDRIETSFRAARGSFEAVVPISAPDEDSHGPRLAFDAAGNALVVWMRFDGAQNVVDAAFRPKGGSFEPSVQISTLGAPASRPQVAFDKKGNAIVVLRQYDGTNTRVAAAFRPKDGSFAAAEYISAAGQEATEPQIAFERSGNAIAIWRRSDGTNSRAEVAFRTAGGSFAPAVQISSTGYDVNKPQIAIDKKGNALALWSGSDGRIEAAFRPKNESFAPAVSLPGETGGDIDLAIDQKGNAVAVWTSSGLIVAAFRPRNGIFGAGETVSSPDRPAYYAQVAFDRKGNALLVWQSTDDLLFRIESSFHPRD